MDVLWVFAVLAALLSRWPCCCCGGRGAALRAAARRASGRMTGRSAF